MTNQLDDDEGDGPLAAMTRIAAGKPAPGDLRWFARGWAAWLLGRGALKRTGYDLPAPLIEWIERNGLLATLLCRPVPVLAEATLILAGAAGIPRRLLLALCAVANLALGCAYAYAGSGGNSGLIDPGAILFGAAVIPVVMTIPVWLLSRVRDIGR